jgi:hypothetical protein
VPNKEAGRWPGVARIGIIAVTLVVTGCQGATTSSVPSVAPPSTTLVPSAEPTATATPTPGPTASPPPSPTGPAALCAEGFAAPCTLDAGAYTTAPFEAAFSFVLSSAWQNDRAWPHGGEIFLPAGAVQWGSGVKEGSVKGVRLDIGPTPADFFAVSDAIPVTIGGVSGQQVDVLTNTIEAPGIFLIEEDAYNLAAGEKVRFYVLDKGGTTVVLTMDAFKAAEFDDFAVDAQPVIDSIAWIP